MTSAYSGRPAELQEKVHQRKLLPYIPLRAKVRDDIGVEVDFMSEGDITSSARLLNEVIEEGRSWPFETPLNRDQFCQYFMSGCALVVRHSDEGIIVGCFYVKPNFPARSSHVANGGFITNPLWRRRGIGTLMGEIFVRVAPDLGYKSALFNLVYTNNVASVKLWSKLGFKVVGTIPGVGRLKGEQQLIDADMYFIDFEAKKIGRWRRVVDSHRTRFALGIAIGVLLGKLAF